MILLSLATTHLSSANPPANLILSLPLRIWVLLATSLALKLRQQHMDPPFLNPTLYISLVGVLQYLTITRPHIAHPINFVDQFLHAPTTYHFFVIKRILRYIEGLHFGLIFRSSTIPSALIACFDADWARCLDTR
ncbi:uncharacterized protein LOC111377007 [Olea europaea var. sylvestris]|uniref:uncharacterized protein LOC111377007 n=1 Tax=Olea europaea var. sylvestris TaxID=158386 RepID=UPI000C1CD834|nr:uncharacterized protein LOC111377007 [Olea europaea var. sylvestris]